MTLLRISYLPPLKIFLILLFAFFMKANVLFAEQDGDFTYTSEGATIAIIGYTGLGGLVVVPPQITGLPVRNIRNSVFSNKASVTGVVVPDSVTSIGNGAFENCTGLVDVDLGNGLRTMGNDVFRGCTSLVNVNIPTSVTTVGQGIFWNCTNLNSASVPNAAVIEIHMFRGCTSLTNVNLGSGVRTIRSWAFQDCQGLIHMTIPDGVTSIKDEAFLDCANLSSVAIGGDVISIEHYAFSHCPALLNIAVAGSNPNYSDVDGILFTHSQNTLVRYPQGRSGSYPVPNGVTSITNAAFHGCSFLTGVIIPASVTSIKASAFFDCTALTTIIIPPNVAAIANYTFSGCTNLTAVVIGEGVTDIGYRAFYGCTSLSGVSIPAGVTTIDDSAFSSSTGLVGATFLGNAPASFGSGVFDETAPGFTVYYYNGSSGFTSPTWHGYPSVILGGGVADIGVSLQGGALANGDPVNFGPLAAGEELDLVFTVTNSGGANLTGLAVSFDGPDASEFTVVGNPLPTTIASDGAASFAVRFSPASGGAKSAMLRIASNDPDENPYLLNLSGVRIESEIGVSLEGGGALANGDPVDFGPLAADEELDFIFTVANSGGAVLSGVAVSFD